MLLSVYVHSLYGKVILDKKCSNFIRYEKKKPLEKKKKNKVRAFTAYICW